MDQVSNNIVSKSRTSKMSNFYRGLSKTKNSSPQFSGYLAIAAVVFVWSGFALSIRAMGTSNLSPADVALIRFVVPILFLMPLIPSRISKLKQISLANFSLVLLGGVPFFLMASEGAKATSAAYVGTLLAGTAPLSVAILAYLFQREKITKNKACSLLLIIIGVISMIAGKAGLVTSETIEGILYLLGASLIWGAYTIGLKQSGFDAITNALLLSLCSIIILALLVATGLINSNFGSFTYQEALPFIIVQGIGVGLISTLGYAFAISRLGAAKAATIGSISPALTALLALPVLGETLSFIVAVGIGITTIGVISYNRFK